MLYRVTLHTSVGDVALRNLSPATAARVTRVAPDAVVTPEGTSSTQAALAYSPSPGVIVTEYEH